MTLCTIDHAVLAAEKAGKEWKTVRGIRSRRQFMRVLRRARCRARVSMQCGGPPDTVRPSRCSLSLVALRGRVSGHQCQKDRTRD
jgi:hypothetical protein